MSQKRASAAQRSLFESSPGVLADDERGRIDYTPGFVAPTVAQAWFEALRDDVEWKAERRRMYDRDVDVPRLTAHFRFDRDPGQGHARPAPIPEAAPPAVAR